MEVKSFEVRPFNDFEQGGGVFICLFLACNNRNVDLGQPNLIVLKVPGIYKKHTDDTVYL